MNSSTLAIIEEAAWKNSFPQALHMVELTLPRLSSLKKIAHTDKQEAIYYQPLTKEHTYTPRDDYLLIKTAAEPWKPSHLFGPVASLGGWKPNLVTKALGGPSTLSASIGSGLLGAGLGYGTGWLMERGLPEEDVRRGRLRKTLALLGGATGAAPALWAGYRGWFKNSSDQEIAQSLEYVKEADVSDFAPVLQRDAFNNLVYQDRYTPLPIQAATTNLVSGASSLRGNSPWISPADVGRLTVGMGSGYLSGLVVGKALGALAGLTPDAQRSLQRAGTWAGFLTSVVPMAFR